MRPLRALRGVTVILVIALASAIGASCLPNNSYQKYQLLDGTIYENLRWVYERIHFDPRPVDVVIVGPSTAVLGLSAPRIERDLVMDGKPAAVASFAIIAAGRNVQWAVLNELYKVKRPKVIVMAIEDTPHPWGHPAFKYVAPAEALVTPPALFLHNFFVDVSYLPFRQVELFGAMLFPGLFRLDSRFDADRYSRFPTDFTVTHGMRDGQWIDMDRTVSPGELRIDAKKHLRPAKREIIPASVTRMLDADDRDYIREIYRLASAHHTQIIFVYIPYFEGPSTLKDNSFYERYGRLLSPADLARRSEDYQGWAHLNHAGAMALSDMVARAVEPSLPAR